MLGVNLPENKWGKEDQIFTFLFVFLPLLGKNAYAMSVLRRVELKLDGQDVGDNRYSLSLELYIRVLAKFLLTLHLCWTSRGISIAEQVDYLLRQATSLDNLCNMYEGWTPWI